MDGYVCQLVAHGKETTLSRRIQFLNLTPKQGQILLCILFNNN